METGKRQLTLDEEHRSLQGLWLMGLGGLFVVCALGGYLLR